MEFTVVASLGVRSPGSEVLESEVIWSDVYLSHGLALELPGTEVLSRVGYLGVVDPSVKGPGVRGPGLRGLGVSGPGSDLHE